jgi:hypothetical protein
MVPLGMVTSDTGGLEPLQARQIVTNFITSLQQTSEPVAPQEPQEWEALNASLHERASWVTRSLLTSLLPPAAFLAWANDMRDAPRGKRTRAVLRRRVADFVALTEGDREFVRLASRRALLEDIADSLGEETNPG